jgi:hypothetical protein
MDSTAADTALTKLTQLVFPRDKPVNYIERQFNSLLKSPIDQQGILWIEASGALIMRVAPPAREERRLYDGRLSLKRSARIRSIRLRPGRASHAVLLAIAELLRGNAESLANQFDLSLTSNLTQGPDAASLWQVQLIPRNLKLQQQLASIQLQGSGDRLISMHADRGSKGWQRIEILEPANLSIDSS